MSRSVRVKRRHAYSSIQDEDSYTEQPPDQPDRGRVLPESDVVPSPAASDSLSPTVPHDTSHLPPNHPAARRDFSRVNRLARSSISYRSFSTDPDPNLSNSPPPTFARLNNVPQETVFEGTSADVVVPPPHRGHAPRVSRVRSALSSSPSRSGQESDSDSDSEDEVMEDDEHHHDDDVVDHLDVIGLQAHIPYFQFFNTPLQTRKLPLLRHSPTRRTQFSCKHFLPQPAQCTPTDVLPSSAPLCLFTLASRLLSFRVGESLT